MSKINNWFINTLNIKTQIVITELRFCNSLEYEDGFGKSFDSYKYNNGYGELLNGCMDGQGLENGLGYGVGNVEQRYTNGLMYGFGIGNDRGFKNGKNYYH